MEVGRDYEYGGTVIKPPMENVSSGKVFKPSSALRNKYWFEAISTAIMIWVLVVGMFFGLMYIIFSASEDLWHWDSWFNQLWVPVNFWLGVITAIWLIPTLILIPIYVNSFEYSVRAESGEAMPEVFVKRGIITITRKVVPMRNITNVATKAGILDRLFGIGNVEIETAGYSGAYQEGPEEKIAGITFYNELKDFITSELRKFSSPYTTATEGAAFEMAVPRMDGSLDDEILITLREMKELLRSINRKLSEGER